MTETFALPARFIDAAELARRLRVTRKTVYRRARAGTLPHVRVGTLLRFDFEAVAEQLRRQPSARRRQSSAS